MALNRWLSVTACPSMARSSRPSPMPSWGDRRRDDRVSRSRSVIQGFGRPRPYLRRGRLFRRGVVIQRRYPVHRRLRALIQGTAEQMYTSLTKLMSLPPQTRLYCGHEYTRANLAFARAVEPDNTAIAARIRETAARRAQGLPTVPSTLDLERRTNPFVRCSAPEVKRAAEGKRGGHCAPTLRYSRLCASGKTFIRTPNKSRWSPSE